MGEKPKTKKPLIRAFSAGGVVFKKEKAGVLWLIMKPAGTSRWQLPKGTIDEGESSAVTAVREVAEEGGVITNILEKLGTSQYFFAFEGNRILKTVTYFLMAYMEDTEKGHDDEVEEAEFFPYTEAYEKLTFKDDKVMLEKAKEALEVEI